ncbi:hypothetical protein BGX38DRAFT_1275872 [Terfezia claveryi]|nr:hypothetical protein BGX38DRAFT_1275872 [Terfezia claveryi]
MTAYQLVCKIQRSVIRALENMVTKRYAEVRTGISRRETDVMVKTMILMMMMMRVMMVNSDDEEDDEGMMRRMMRAIVVLVVLGCGAVGHITPDSDWLPPDTTTQSLLELFGMVGFGLRSCCIQVVAISYTWLVSPYLLTIYALLLVKNSWRYASVASWRAFVAMIQFSPHLSPPSM